MPEELSAISVGPLAETIGLSRANLPAYRVSSRNQRTKWPDGGEDPRTTLASQRARDVSKIDAQARDVPARATQACITAPSVCRDRDRAHVPCVPFGSVCESRYLGEGSD